MSWLADWFGADSYAGKLGDWAVGEGVSTAVPSATSTVQAGSSSPSSSGSMGSVFMDPKFLGGALNTAVSLGSQLWADKAAQKNADEDRRLAAQELALKAQYGLLGNQGGGGSGTANLLNAYKSAADMTAQSAQAKGQALERLIAASTRPLLR